MKKTKHGDYEKKVLFPVFSNYQVRIVFSDDIGKSYAVRFKRALPRDVDTTGAFHAYSTSGCSHLFFRIGNAPSGTVAHEVVHAVIALLIHWSGVEMRNLDEEVLAYHVGYLVGEVVDCRNWLIDKGVGVKSSNTGGPDGLQSSQGSHGSMRRMQSRQATKG